MRSTVKRIPGFSTHQPFEAIFFALLLFEDTHSGEAFCISARLYLSSLLTTGQRNGRRRENRICDLTFTWLLQPAIIYVYNPSEC